MVLFNCSAASRLKVVWRALYNVKSSETVTAAPCIASMSTQAADSDDVLFEAHGCKRIITFNRPKALNALNLSMVEKLIPKLKDWQSDKNISLIIFKGSGEKSFCAGGDIKAIIDEGRKDPRSMAATHFFRREYVLNNLIGSCSIPIIAMIDGFTMGGGVGLSVHTPFRVATETTVFAMPETAIGLFPDVGGSYFLPRLRGALGMYLALTGYRLKGEDVQKSGVATHYVTKKNGAYKELVSDLLSLSSPNKNDINDILDKHHKQCCTDNSLSLAPHLDKIDKIFDAESLEQIYSGLSADDSDWANQTLATLLKMSPTSMKVTIEQLNRGRHLSLAQCLAMELRIGRTIMLNKDFYEGVRAVLVDKDNSPKWEPSSIEDVSKEFVQTFFDPMPPNCELDV